MVKRDPVRADSRRRQARFAVGIVELQLALGLSDTEAMQVFAESMVSMCEYAVKLETQGE